MRLSRPRATQPTRAERVRSILTVAHSMTVVSDGLHTEVRRLDGTGAMGHIHLHAPNDGSHAPSGERVPARLEFTDIAPLPYATGCAPASRSPGCWPPRTAPTR